jgi:hypothetical protein
MYYGKVVAMFPYTFRFQNHSVDFVGVLALIVCSESCQTNWVVVHFNRLSLMKLKLSTISFFTVDHYVKDLYET